jgi:hypothetical protein
MTDHRDEQPDGGDWEDDIPRDRLDAMDNLVIDYVKAYADVYFETMQHGPRVAERFFDHPDPALRLAAVATFCFRWDSDEGFKAACERLAWADGDDTVRIFAIAALGGHYATTSDSRIGAFLAEIVHDETQDSCVRRSAYFSLHRIRGRSFLELSPREDFRFPEDVDWSLVSIFLTGD